MSWLLLVSPWSLTGLDARPDDRRRADTGVVAGTDGLSDLGSVTSALEVLLTDGLLDPVNLVLVPLPVPHSALLSLLQRGLKSLNNDQFKSLLITIVYSTKINCGTQHWLAVTILPI